jgi:hypothetical protein
MRLPLVMGKGSFLPLPDPRPFAKFALMCFFYIDSRVVAVAQSGGQSVFL